jgi:hypothetical protein
MRLGYKFFKTNPGLEGQSKLMANNEQKLQRLHAANHLKGMLGGVYDY